MTVNRRRMPKNRDTQPSYRSSASEILGKDVPAKLDAVTCKEVVSSDSSDLYLNKNNTETKIRTGQQVTTDTSTRNAYRAVEMEDDIFAEDDSAPCLPTVSMTQKDRKECLSNTVEDQQEKELTVSSELATSSPASSCQEPASAPVNDLEKTGSNSTASVLDCLEGATNALPHIFKSQITSTSNETVNSGTNLKKEHCSRTDGWLRSCVDCKLLTFCKQAILWGIARWIAPTLRVYLLLKAIALCFAWGTLALRSWNELLFPVLVPPT
jgi:hypothetical protein